LFFRETADKIIRGNGKFEELMAASQEIAAACAQLVVASRVKANSSSKNLAKLSMSSKLVLQATGNVIATTKHCSKLIEESGELSCLNQLPCFILWLNSILFYSILR